MGRKRFKDQILCEILQMCGDGGANKTQIVYSCNLNFHTVVPYLERLIRNGLAERIDSEIVRYQATTKGLQVLGCFRQIEEAIPEMRGERGQTLEGF